MKINSYKLKITLFIVSVIILCILAYYFMPVFLNIIRTLISLFLPFILGYLFSRLVNPLADLLQKKLKCPRSVSALLVIVITIGIIGGVVTAIVWNLVNEIRNLYAQSPQIYAELQGYWNKFAAMWSDLYKNMPMPVQEALTGIGEGFSAKMSDFIDSHSKPVVGYASDFAKAIPDVFIAIIIFILSVYFMVADNKTVSSVVHRMLGVKMLRRIDGVKGEFKRYLSGYVKAQFTIMCVTFTVMLIEFALADISYSVLIAISTAFFDALPVFGSGLVLWPLALINFISGNIKNGIMMLVAYASVFVTRHLIEPKLVSSKMGMNPILTLMAMYVGYRIWGVVGIILGTIILLVIISFYRAGVFDAPIRGIRSCGRFIGSQYKLFKKFISELMEDNNE